MKSTLEYLYHAEPENYKVGLKQLVEQIRPQEYKAHYREKDKNPSSQLENLIALLKTYPELRVSLQKVIKHLFENHNQIRLYTESGIPDGNGFFKSLGRKLTYKFFPPEVRSTSFKDTLNFIFYKNNDYKWLEQIPNELWSRFFKEMAFEDADPSDYYNIFIEQLLNSIQVLSHRITALGLETEIIDKFPKLEKFESPFLAQNDEITHLIKNFEKGGSVDKSLLEQDYKQSRVLLSQCEEIIREIRKSRDETGASLMLTTLLLRLQKSIERLYELLDLVIAPNQEAALPYLKTIRLFKKLVFSENRKNSIRDHIDANVDLLALQVTEHAGKTGEHYITKNRQEYRKMFRSALAGGLIVGFLSCFKVLAYYLRLAPFGTAFLYSMNYSLGFILIFVTKATLATKQPAMTATKIAQSLDKDYSDRIAIANLAEMIVRVSRSQFVAFVGNVVLAFPIAYGAAMAYYWYYGEHLAGPQKSLHLIHELHPWESLSLFHAGIAGVCLFVSGVISGYYDNSVVYNKIPQRIKQHRIMNKIFGKKLTHKIGTYIENNLGSLAGNFFLGIFLGSIGTIGFILGLPLDIRHITFASGNFGLAFAGLDHAVDWQTFSITFLGIAGIGFVNFIVSFGLALFVAIKSRKVNFKQSALLGAFLWKRFRLHPSQFFFAPKISVVDVIPKKKGK